MAYFDFVMSQIHGFRIKELQDHEAAGGTVTGTFCLYVPEEMIRALGGLAVGLCDGRTSAGDEVWEEALAGLLELSDRCRRGASLEQSLASVPHEGR